MKNFEFLNPTKLVFGKDEENKIGKILAQDKIKKVLLLYGKDSIKKNGLYDNVVKQLEANQIKFVEHGGVVPNPLLSHANEGVQKAKEVDAVLAVGGGSVVDEAKAICAGVKTCDNVWDIITAKTKVKSALPLYDILTLSATASEMNGGFVITNQDTNEKRAIGYIHCYPKVSIVNPEISVNFEKSYLPYAAIDIISHSLETYLHAEEFPLLSSSITEGLIKTVMQITPKLLDDMSDYSMKANFALSSTMALNGMISQGVGSSKFPMHQMSHVLSGLFNIPHGLALSITDIAYIKYAKDKLKNRLQRLGQALFGVSDENATIEKLEEFFISIGSKTKLKDLGFDKDLEKITNFPLPSFTDDEKTQAWSLA